MKFQEMDLTSQAHYERITMNLITSALQQAGSENDALCALCNAYVGLAAASPEDRDPFDLVRFLVKVVDEQIERLNQEEAVEQ